VRIRFLGCYAFSGFSFVYIVYKLSQTAQNTKRRLKVIFFKSFFRQSGKISFLSCLFGKTKRCL